MKTVLDLYKSQMLGAVGCVVAAAAAIAVVIWGLYTLIGFFLRMIDSPYAWGSGADDGDFY